MLDLWLSGPLVSAPRPFVWRADLIDADVFIYERPSANMKQHLSFETQNLVEEGNRIYSWYVLFCDRQQNFMVHAL